MKTHTKRGGAQGVAAVDRFVAVYQGGALENPRAADAAALRARLVARMEAKWQAKHDAAVRAQWKQVKGFVRAGGPEAKVAVTRFLKAYRGHELGNPVADEAEAALVRLSGRKGRGAGRTGKAGVVYIRIKGGRFKMGSNSCDADEKPVHTVRVPTFYLAKTEVTVAQYRACVDAGACAEPKTGGSYNWGKHRRDEHPINCVDWSQAKAFATWAGGRLPTEAEWEYAARSGGRDQKHPWGDAKPTCALAIMSGCSFETQPVCSKSAGHSAQGVCDLAGNVWEWTEDWYASDYSATPRDGSSHDKASVGRVGRGGSWFGPGANLRAAYRGWGTPSGRGNYFGFRLSRLVP